MGFGENGKTASPARNGRHALPHGKKRTASRLRPLLPDTPQRLAEPVSVLCGVSDCTLRQVLEYSPQSTIRNSARHSSAFRGATAGNEDAISAGRGNMHPYKKSRIAFFEDTKNGTTLKSQEESPDKQTFNLSKFLS